MCVSMYMSRLYAESKNHLKELVQFSPSTVWVPGTKSGSLSWHLASFPYEPPCQPCLTPHLCPTLWMLLIGGSKVLNTPLSSTFPQMTSFNQKLN